MTDRVRWLAVGCAVVMFGISHHVCAQDELDVLLQDLNGGNQDADAPAAVEAARPAVLALDGAEGDEDDPQAKFIRGAVTPEDDALISELVALEKLRREAYDGHGRQAFETAEKLLLEGNNIGAVDQYKQALDYLSNRPTNEALRKGAEEGMMKAYYREAEQLRKRKEYDEAKLMAQEALKLGHSQAASFIEHIPVSKPVDFDPSRIIHRKNEDAFQKRQDDIRKRLRKSRQHFATSEYDKAMEECELILHIYPNQEEAIDLRRRIAERLNGVKMSEFLATRTALIKDVSDAWTAPVYAQNSPQLPKIERDRGGTKRTPSAPGGNLSESQKTTDKLRSIILPEVSFRPPATIIDAIDFFKNASRDYDDATIDIKERGVNLILKLPTTGSDAGAISDDPFAAPSGGATGAPVIPAMTARNISLYEALRLVCEVTSMKFRVSSTIVMIVPLDDPDDELEMRSYNVLPSFVERIGTASTALSSQVPAGTGWTTTSIASTSEEDDYKKFFQQMGVKWPIGSSITYLLGRLRVTNTADQLARFEQLLTELNVTEKLVEIEARFVEVSQEDLNSLGFEWMLNGDFSFNPGGFARNVLGLKNYQSMQLTTSDGIPLWADAAQTIPLLGKGPYGTAANALKWFTDSDGNTVPYLGALGAGQSLVSRNYGKHSMMVNAIDGTTFSPGMRYPNTEGNPLIGQGTAINDQFMRLNAFIGGADVSMILHMLSQRSDTDLLSAPKVTVSPDQEAIMKVVTEYIYPSEFNVQISQQGTSNTGFGGGGTGEPLAIVEPQNFTMREVGVILQVIPKLSEDGQMITLTLRPQVVSEPVWKNYGTRVPRQTVVPGGTIGGALQGDTLVTEYIELPMEQPFFNVRSVETQLTINNGATVVMGGLITEARVTIEDKIPLLGDIPYLGRLFRSRAEKTNKRNLLIFVTARTLGTDGRYLAGTGGDALMSSPGVLETPPPMVPEGQ